FSENELNKATILRDKMKNYFEDKVFFVGDMIPVPIGPHPLPMFEANFPQEIFTEVVLWLMKERGNFTVLVHPLSGDDYYDHTQGAMWLGKTVDLNYSIF
ncbi:MAG: DOPA 4,5-dioxygenase family protein, partial [Bdellovibrionales bacterium]|nr:DOPA 4,5-dioxygenase family protein [Bdellovibrionales bacterium]